MPEPIYLDHNATTPVAEAVVDAMLPYLREHYGNPSSSHVFGQRARRAVETARGQVADLLGARPDEIVFTSGGTEANNLAIRGVARGRTPGHVLTSSVEHPATSAPCCELERSGWAVTRAPVDGAGRVDPARVEEALRDDTVLVTIMHANNETGAIQPVEAVAAAAHGRGAVLHTDAAQSAGKVPVGVDALGVDLLSIAGHKLHAPKGVGALYVRRALAVSPVLVGAGHEGGVRPGTENVASIVGLGVACAIARQMLDTEIERQSCLCEDLLARLLAGVPGLVLNGPRVERLPNTLNVRFPGVRGTAVLEGAPEIAASTGSACHEGGESASSVLLAMGLDEDEALGSVRLSIGRGTTAADVLVAADALVRSWRALSRIG